MTDKPDRLVDFVREFNAATPSELKTIAGEAQRRVQQAAAVHEAVTAAVSNFKERCIRAIAGLPLEEVEYVETVPGPGEEKP